MTPWGLDHGVVELAVAQLLEHLRRAVAADHDGAVVALVQEVGHVDAGEAVAGGVVAELRSGPGEEESSRDDQEDAMHRRQLVGLV